MEGGGRVKSAVRSFVRLSAQASTSEVTLAASVEVVDYVPERIRRPVDLVRLSALALAILLLAGLGTVATATLHGANADLSRGAQEVPQFFVRALSLLGTFGALALPVALVIRELARNQQQRLVEAIGTGLLAVGVVGLGDVLISSQHSTALHAALTEAGTHTTLRPLDAYIAALCAFVVVVGVAGDPAWRTTFWLAAGVYVVSAFVAAQASALSLLASPALGALVGIAVRYLAGSANLRPDGRTIAAALLRRDLDLVTIVRVPSTDASQRSYRATTRAGQELSLQVLDRDLIASGAVYSLYRRLRIRAEIATPPTLTLERVGEHRALLGYAAAAADVRSPRFIASASCGPDSIVLVYAQPAVVPLQAPTDVQLDDLWSQLGALHRARVTHRGITAESLRVDQDGRVVLPILIDGVPFASDLRISLDQAQVLIATAQLVGPTRAVAAARAALGTVAVSEIVPLLQPIALSRETRSAIRHNADLLAGLREELLDQLETEPPSPVRVERFRPRTIVSIAALIVAAYFLVGQLGTVDVVTVLGSTRWRWVPLVLLASVGTYFAAGLSLIGFVRERLSYTRTVLVQVAASFVGFVAPPSVGGIAINIRYLRKAKVSATGAATSVGTSQIINALLHFLLLIIFAAATGTASDKSLPIPGWAFAAFGAVVVLSLLLLTVPAPRRWLLAQVVPRAREVLPRLLTLVTSPKKLAQALFGSLLLNAGYIGALWFSVHAFAGNISFAGVAVVYLAGAAVASAAPTPGGLGAVELALSTGLAASGMPSTAAVSAVLLFRIATFWLPVPAGWIALQLLQHRDAI